MEKEIAIEKYYKKRIEEVEEVEGVEDKEEVEEDIR